MSYLECKQQCIDMLNAVIAFDRKRLSNHCEFRPFAILVEESLYAFSVFEKSALASRVKTVDADYDAILALRDQATRKINNARKQVQQPILKI